VDFNIRYEKYKALVESALSHCLSDLSVPQKRLREAMRYSLLAGGKRIRPVLLLEFCRISGGDVDDALPFALGVEMLHSYSLIHDDLPCMDNDDQRRGKPSLHLAFDEMTAVLAGDALQAEAFKMMLRSSLAAEIRASCASILAEAVGESGMCGGQILDMLSERKILTSDDLHTIHNKKTAALFRASCTIGAIVGGANGEMLAATDEYARSIGLAFQIRDDMLDATGTADELGKNPGSDIRSKKQTFFTIYGGTECQRLVHELSENAKKAAASVFSDNLFLCQMADWLCGRMK
jgi:geranylgeranyl diphosphate synthase type II